MNKKIKKKNVLIINHQNFSNIGGIEKWLYYLTKFCIDNHIRVIWLCEKGLLIHEAFKDIMMGEQVERVYVSSRKFHWFSLDRINLRDNERYVIFCANPIRMCAAQDIMLKYKDYDFFPIYVVPDTTGNSYFLERFFKRDMLNKTVLYLMRKMMLRWEGAQSIRFFNRNQAKSLENNYKIEICDIGDKLLKSVIQLKGLDEERILSRSRNTNPFIISTVGRFDFPHKGYMLGLVRSFGRLKQDYPHIELHIAGYGPHEELLRKEIGCLPDNAKNSVVLHGPINPESLDDFYKSAHINVSVAGAATGGARVGTLTLVARNYCDSECEVYGFYQDSYNKTTSTERGLPLEPFLRKVLEMSDCEYVDYCRKGYDSYANRRTSTSYNPLYIFESTENLFFEPFYREVRLMKLLKRMISINNHISIF